MDISITRDILLFLAGKNKLPLDDKKGNIINEQDALIYYLYYAFYGCIDGQESGVCEAEIDLYRKKTALIQQKLDGFDNFDIDSAYSELNNKIKESQTRYYRGIKMVKVIG